MKTYGICALACCLVLLVLLGFQNISYAADNSTIIDAGTGITSFDTPLKTIANSVVGSAKVIAVIMTAVAGFMYVLGIENAWHKNNVEHCLRHWTRAEFWGLLLLAFFPAI